MFDLCLANSSPIPKEVAERYAGEGAEPICCDAEACAKLGVELIRRPVATVEEGGYVRHHSDRLAQELILLHTERSVRIAGDRFQERNAAYRRERQREKRPR